MVKLTPLQRLDEVLKIMQRPANSQAEIFARTQIEDKIKNLPDLTNEDANEIVNQSSQILDKLYKDGYITFDLAIFDNDYKTYGNRAYKKYIITLEGELFIIEGGYVTYAEKEKRQKRIQNQKDYLLIGGTWLAGLGAFALVLVELWKMALEHHFFSCGK